MADESIVTTETTSTENPSTETVVTPTPESGSSTTENPSPTDETIDLGAKPEEKTEEKVEPTDEEKAAAEAKAALFGAPEGDAEYEITGLPDGVTIDKEALEAATPVFKELGLSNEGASKVAGIYAEKVLPIVAAKFKTDLEQQVVDQRAEWQGDTLAAIKGETELKTATGDKIDFGGAAVKQVQQMAAKAIDRIAPEGFREFLDETGLGQHPAMVAFAFRVGQLTAEDESFGGGGGPTPQPKTKTEKYYNR
jgi:hypothetical protein